ncbi:copper homeostasis protein CutC [Gluconobacter morbifer]|uniref:PF03932 family protein CutC n=1 Tax=Gluconobacter morbifer G707 TaxID=1088869 RepID=G6XEW4_9PROT|nr:copper homeostasis protein CutC [Gluconobacter morbifer]EHH68722.1 copper homeostasis protein cutC [Gluconobacter morbifer G707]
MTELEICVDTSAGLAVAQSQNVSRIELCSALALGGLTPSPGLMHLASNSPVPVYAMIRPRSGNFVFTPLEEAAMLADIAAARSAGLAGVVLGASMPDQSLNEAMLKRLITSCGSMGRTLHRAFDLVPDPSKALETVIRLGFDRILTSGCAPTAPEGMSVLKALVQQARGRIDIMGGSGVTPDNVAMLVRETGINAVHGSCRPQVSANSEKDLRTDRSIQLGFGTTPPLPSPAVIQAVRTAMQNHEDI